MKFPYGVADFKKDKTETGNLKLKIPNLVMRKLYAERIITMLLPEPADRDDGRLAENHAGYYIVGKTAGQKVRRHI